MDWNSKIEELKILNGCDFVGKLQAELMYGDKNRIHLTTLDTF